LTIDGDAYPFAKHNADGWEVEGKGKLGRIKFAGGDMYARKSMTDPDLVSHSWIHNFEAPGNVVCRRTLHLTDDYRVQNGAKYLLK